MRLTGSIAAQPTARSSCLLSLTVKLCSGAAVPCTETNSRSVVLPSGTAVSVPADADTTCTRRRLSAKCIRQSTSDSSSQAEVPTPSKRRKCHTHTHTLQKSQRCTDLDGHIVARLRPNGGVTANAALQVAVGGGHERVREHDALHCVCAPCQARRVALRGALHQHLRGTQGTGHLHRVPRL